MSKQSLKKLQRLIYSVLVLLLVLVFNQYPELLQLGEEVPAGTYRVVSVEDGDTIVVDMNGTDERVRFIGVDTPETRDPRKPVQCFGHAASEFTTSLISDNPVRLVADPLSTNRDRYNRLLRYVYLPDNTLVQAEIIKHGYGFAYTSFPFEKSEEFLKFQREARQESRGLWSGCSPTANDYGGYDSNPAN